MIEWSKISGFQWDSGNERKSEVKHGVTRLEAEQVFFNQPLLVMEDSTHSRTETRFHALGKSETSRLLHVSFTLRSASTLIRVISARDMHRKERALYEQTQENPEI